MTTPSDLSPVYAVECGPEGCGVYLLDLWSKVKTTTTDPDTTRDLAKALSTAELWSEPGRPCRVVTIDLSVRETS